MRLSLTLAILGLTYASAFGAAGDNVRVSAQVDTARDVYAGEDFQYHIVIDGIRQAGQVDTAPLSPWNPRSAGVQDLSRTVTQIINGRSSTQVIERIAMTYLLTAPAAGRITLPSVSVVVQGRTYRTEPVTLNIAEPGTTDLLDVEIAVTPSQCYVGQPVELAVRFFVGQDIRNSQFNIPVLANDAFRLEMPDTVPAGASQSELAPGVTMIVTQQTTVHKGRRAELFTLRNILLPQRPGTFAIEPVTVSTDMAVGRTRSRDPFFDDFSFFGSQTQYKRFQVRSQPSSLTVRPLPEEGRPAGFYGLVGDYEITAEASVTKVNVGDPITLMIKVAGGFLKPVQWPDLSGVGGPAKDFKIPDQQASPVVENGFKVFTQTLRANNDSVTEIPSIELPHFSPTKGRYVVARTRPIPLEVAHTRILTGADIEGRQSVTLSKEVEAIRQGISANYEDPDCLVDRTFSPLAALVSPAYGLLWAGPLIALLASAGARVLGRNDPRKQAAARRRKARAVAARRLKTVLAASGSERPAEMVEAMRQYVGDCFDRVPGSLTADDCCRIIHQAGGDVDAAGRYRDIMAQYEASRYAPAQAAVDDAGVAEVLELIRRIDAKTRK